MARMSVVVTSCDGYSDLWDPFFKLMDAYWEGMNYPVYLNTETIQYNKEFCHFNVKSINLLEGRKPGSTSWSRRMLDVLERTSEEYVMILVEDFFLRETVQTELIEQLLDRMDQDKTIGQIQLFGVRTNCDNERQNIISETMTIEQIGDNKAKVCFVPTIWRKSVLVRWLRPWETIWAFESCGAARAKRWKYPEKVYRIYAPAVFNYLWEKGCYCVVNGKWMIHPLLTDLFAQHDIKIDYNQRGTITMEEWKRVDTAAILKRYSLPQIAVKSFNRFRSLF